MDKVMIIANVYDEYGFVGFSVFNYSDYRIHITNDLNKFDIWGIEITNSKLEYKGYKSIPNFYLNLNYLDKHEGVVLGRMGDKIISFNYFTGFQLLKEIDFIRYSKRTGIDFVNVDFIAYNTKVRSIYSSLPNIDINRFTRKTLKFINEVELFKSKENKRLKIQNERQKAINEAITLTNSEYKYLNTYRPKNEKERQKQIDDRKNWVCISELMYHFDELTKNDLGFLRKGKKSMFQINRSIDSSDLRNELLKFDPSPCVENLCRETVNKALSIVDSNNSRDFKIEKLNNLFESNIGLGSNELCKYCLTMLKIEGIITCLNEDVYGLIIGESENIFIDVSQVKRYEIPYIQECYHEYIHYLTTKNGKSGFITLNKIDVKTKNIQIFFTEGFTELLSFYLTYRVVESYYSCQNKRLYNNGKVVTIGDLEKYYLPMIYDLKHLKKFRNINDSIKDFENTSDDIDILGWSNSGYYFNLYVLFYILQKIGIEFGIACFCNNDFFTFETKCLEKLGNNWNDIILKLGESTLSKKDIAEILNLLK